MGDLGKGTCEALCIPVLMKDIGGCIKTLDKTQQCIYKSHYQDVIKEGRYQVLSIIRQIKEQNCRKPSLVPKEDIERDIFMTEMESEIEETKIQHVRKEWSQQQQTMARLQEYLYKKCRLLSLHSSYCSTQGSALCAILARLMEYPELVEVYLAESDMYLVNFIKIADGCLFSFVKTYAYDAPVQDSTDYRYILALYTCITHISSLRNGRQFLIQQEEGQNMLSEITYIIPLIKHSTVKALKTLLLKILHNLKSEEDGLNFLRSCSEIYSTLDTCISTEYDPETHIYALELLEGVTKEVPNRDQLEKITNIINTQRLKELSGQMYKDVNHIPRKIFQNIRIAADKIIAREQEQAQGDVRKSQSGRNVCKCESKKLELEKTPAVSPRKVCSLPKKDSQTRQMGSPRVVCRPSSASSSTYVSTTEISESTSYPPSRAAPERRSRPVSRPSRSKSADKSITLCTSPCRYLFPDSSPGVTKTHSKERPSNIPIRIKCVPACSSSRTTDKRSVAPSDSFSKTKQPGSSSSNYGPPSNTPIVGGKPSSSRPTWYHRPSSCTRSSSSSIPRSNKTSSSRQRPASSSRAPSKERPSSSKIPCPGDRPSKIKSSSSHKSCRSKPSSKDNPCYNKIPCSGSKLPCTERPSSGNVLSRIKDKIIELASSASKKILELAHRASDVSICADADTIRPCPAGKSSSYKLTFATKASKTSSKFSCTSSSKSKNKSAIPVAKKSYGNKKVPCSCTKSPESKNLVKFPPIKTGGACMPTCKGSCKYKKRKVSSPAFKGSSKKPKKPCSCAPSDGKKAPPGVKDDKPKSSQSKVGTKTQQPPTRLVCTDKPLSPDMKNRESFPVSHESKKPPEQPSSCVKEAKRSPNEGSSKGISCKPSCTSPLGEANTASPATSSPSVTVTQCEKEICTCGCQSERSVVPWTEENRMVARLSEIDRRVFHHAQNTVRIVSRLDHNAAGRTQRVITRIKIPGMRFQRVLEQPASRSQDGRV